MKAKLVVSFNLASLPQIGGKLLRNGYNRLLHGPAWGLSRAATRMAKSINSDLPFLPFRISGKQGNTLESRLSNLGITQITPMKEARGISAREISRFLRSLLYNPVQRGVSSDFLLCPEPVRETAHIGIRTELERNWKSYDASVRFIKIALGQFVVHALEQYDLEAISDLLAVLPRKLTNLRKDNESFDTMGSGFKEKVGEVTYNLLKGDLLYSSELIEYVNSYLDQIGEKKNDVLAYMHRKNPLLLSVLLGGTVPPEEIAFQTGMSLRSLSKGA